LLLAVDRRRAAAEAAKVRALPAAGVSYPLISIVSFGMSRRAVLGESGSPPAALIRAYRDDRSVANAITREQAPGRTEAIVAAEPIR
jgi:hypothetical protein